jgi:dienelactone hydrolase
LPDRTGPSTAKTAIFIVYDIFGFSPQGLQGADILAHADDDHHQYQVFIPDLFFGQPFSKADFPPDTEEKKKKLGDFFGGPADPGATSKKLPAIVDQLTQLSGAQKWGVLGQCWGGKIVSLTSGSGTKWTAAAEVHPAMVDPEEAKGIKIPMCMLASMEEEAETVKKFGENLTGPKVVERFDDQVHGWMAARGDLKDEKVKKEYQRGYQMLLDFYHEHL